MKRSFKIAAVVALLVAAPSWAASSMTYTIELGGDNHVADWDNGLNTPYTRAANGDQDGQIYQPGDAINWAVLVAVSGTHEDPGGFGDGLLPSGAANMVFDLELWKDGVLVDIGAATVDSNGQPTSAGWYSSINDGACRDPRCIISGPNPLLNAAYAIAYDIDGNGAQGGRVWDAPASGGPFVDFFHYPSAQGRPAASTAAAGTLVGMGAGYKEFKPTSDGGQNTAGVGTTVASGACEPLGVKPVFEGQISTAGLAGGTYTLVLKADAGNNVLPGDDEWGASPIYICSTSPVGRFAIAPNNVVEDDITFVIDGPEPECDDDTDCSDGLFCNGAEVCNAGFCEAGVAPCSGEQTCDEDNDVCIDPCTDPVLQTAQSVRTHGAAGTFGIDLLSGAKIDPRSGAVKIEAVYDVDVAVTGATASSGTPVASAVGNKITVDVTGATGNQPLVVSFTAENAADGSCSAVTTLCVRLCQGDASTDGNANVLDLVQIRNSLNTTPVAATFPKDINADGNINVLDLVQARNNLNMSVPVCP